MKSDEICGTNRKNASVMHHPPSPNTSGVASPTEASSGWRAIRRTPSSSTPGGRRSTKLGALLAALLLTLVTLAPATTALGQSQRVQYLLRMLSTSDAFRVRSQAALSLGGMDRSPAVVRGLSQALRDDHPSVRTAAASALARLGDPSALEALQAVRRDRDRGARRAIAAAIRTLSRARTQPDPGGQEPSTPAQYYVGLARPATRVDRLSSSQLDSAYAFLRQELGRVDGVRVAPEGENNRAARRAIRRARLRGYFIDSSIVTVDESAAGTRVVVSVILNTYPGRDMRAILQGSATVPGARGAQAIEQGIQGAFRGALRRLPQAMASSRR